MNKAKSIFIVGGGHAGVEAAHAISRLGAHATIVSMDLGAVARMSCNPAIGGLAKSHLVHEIDALGGIMSVAADSAGIQFKTLNSSKGRAVRSLRVQTDKKKYPIFVNSLLKNNNNISFLEGEVVSFSVSNNCVDSITLRTGEKFSCAGLIITSGTFLNGLIHIGEKSFRAGRIGEVAAEGLTECLQSLGFVSGRLKTGTPPRLLKKSINWEKATRTAGDQNPKPFSLFRSSEKITKNIDSFSVNTNVNSHSILLENVSRSPMYSGKIKAAGPRYCPSIEDKVVRFESQPSHTLFLEPEWEGSDQIYLSGFSTSLPEEIQETCLKTISGLEDVEIIRPGYAIEYDYFPTYQLKRTLESKNIHNLFFAGQINGTSGYEEAAAQGLIAGTNAALKTLNKDPFVLSREEAYIGVLIDDLVTKSINEPYRMFTSRAEFRLSLRPDNVYERLGEKGFCFGVVPKSLYNKYLNLFSIGKDFAKVVQKKSIKDQGKTVPLLNYIKRPSSTLFQHIKARGRLEEFALFSEETKIKYEGYVSIERKRAEKVRDLENSQIPKGITYKNVPNLSSEAIEKLSLVLPETVAQASRIDGVSSSDISSLCVFLVSKGFFVSRETV